MKKRVISIVLLLGCVLMLVSAAVLQTEQQKLSEKLIRLHVVANSDSAHDQQIKLRVRDAILEKRSRCCRVRTIRAERWRRIWTRSRRQHRPA